VAILRVIYLELTDAPADIPPHSGAERIAPEQVPLDTYLALYKEVGAPLRWDQRLNMPREQLTQLLECGRLRIYILRDAGGEPLGFCEFDRGAFPEVELKHFGLLPRAQGRGLGPWLLRTALHSEWSCRPRRIWLHTDNWDHPAALPVYQRAGFRIYLERDEPSANL
jgi:GNAT superfamily N-acetyltransferase